MLPPKKCCWAQSARRPDPGARAGGKCRRTLGIETAEHRQHLITRRDTQFHCEAVGCADANRRIDPESDAVTLVCTGDGATSEGEFWESLNIACLEKLAIIYLVEDNGYAISVPVECQTAGDDDRPKLV